MTGLMDNDIIVEHIQNQIIAGLATKPMRSFDAGNTGSTGTTGGTGSTGETGESEYPLPQMLSCITIDEACDMPCMLLMAYIH